MGAKGTKLLQSSRFFSSDFSPRIFLDCSSPTSIVCLAHSNSLDLFAFAVSGGSIFICGKFGVSLILRDSASLGGSTEIFYLAFLSDSRLISVTPTDLKIWSLDTASVIHSSSFSSPISSANLSSEFSGRFLFFSFASSIFLFDCKKLKFSAFKISLQEISSGSNSGFFSRFSGSPDVSADFSCSVGTLSQSVEFSQLLLGLSTGAVISWHIANQKIHRIYQLNDGNSHGGVSCLSWSPDGEYFSVGFSDGLISVWRRKENSAPVKYFFLPSVNSNIPNSAVAPLRHPVMKFQWLTVPSSIIPTPNFPHSIGFLVAGGGFLSEPGALIFIYGPTFDERRILSPSSISGDIIDFHAKIIENSGIESETLGSAASAYLASINSPAAPQSSRSWRFPALSVVSVSSKGRAELFYPGLGVGPISIFPFDSRPHSAIKSINFIDPINQATLDSIMEELKEFGVSGGEETRRRLRSEGFWPASGGNSSFLRSGSETSPSPYLLLTGSNGIIRFWNCSNPFSLDLLAEFDFLSLIRLDGSTLKFFDSTAAANSNSISSPSSAATAAGALATLSAALPKDSAAPLSLSVSGVAGVKSPVFPSLGVSSSIPPPERLSVSKIEFCIFSKFLFIGLHSGEFLAFRFEEIKKKSSSAGEENQKESTSNSKKMEFRGIYSLAFKSAVKLIEFDLILDRLFVCDERGNFALVKLNTGEIVSRSSQGIAISSANFSSRSIIAQKQANQSANQNQYFIYLAPLDGSIIQISAIDGSTVSSIPKQLDDQEDRNSSAAPILMKNFSISNQRNEIDEIQLKEPKNNSKEISTNKNDKKESDREFDSNHYFLSVSQRCIKLIAVEAKKFTVLNLLIPQKPIVTAGIIQANISVQRDLKIQEKIKKENEAKSPSGKGKEKENSESENAANSGSLENSISSLEDSIESLDFDFSSPSLAESSLFTVDVTGSLIVYSLMELKILLNFRLDPIPLPHWSAISIGSDGRFASFSDSRSIAIGSIFPLQRFSIDARPPEIIGNEILRNEEKSPSEAAPAKSWTFTSLFSSGAASNLELFEAPNQIEKEAEIAAKREKEKERENLDEEMKRWKRESGRTEGKSANSETAATMAESRRMAAENLEKLKEMGDKSAKLSDDAGGFAAAARKLRQNAESSWW